LDFSHAREQGIPFPCSAFHVTVIGAPVFSQVAALKSQGKLRANSAKVKGFGDHNLLKDFGAIPLR
jgi:hypothetical protein